MTSFSHAAPTFEQSMQFIEHTRADLIGLILDLRTALHEQSETVKLRQSEFDLAIAQRDEAHARALAR